MGSSALTLLVVVLCYCFLETTRADNYVSITENATVLLRCGKIFNADSAGQSNWLNSEGVYAVGKSTPRFTVTKNGSLMIENVRRTDAGQYKCNSRIKTDRGWTPKSVVVYLNVKCKSTLTSITLNVCSRCFYVYISPITSLVNHYFRPLQTPQSSRDIYENKFYSNVFICFWADSILLNMHDNSIQWNNGLSGSQDEELNG